MRERVSRFDWSATPLGPRDQWPTELHVVVDLLLESGFPTALIWGPALTTIYNDPFEVILGERTDALGKSFADVWYDEWEAIAPIARRALDGEATFIENFPLDTTRHGHPERSFFTFCYSPVRDAHGTVMGFLDTVIETTGSVLAQEMVQRTNVDLEAEVRRRTDERDTLERTGARELESAQNQLRQAQKMEAFGQLTGGIAHDFNNLLQAVSGSLEMLGRKYVKEEAGYRYLRLADQALDRAAHLTRQLLAFARKQPLEVKALDTIDAIARSIDLAARSLPENIEVDRQFGPGTWPAMSDPNQLDVAILNLVINARDAMPDGGRITVSTVNVIAPGPDATDTLAPGDYVKVAIADTGTGMSAETQARVFEPFFTTKDVGKGTGLGLSQVYGFAHQSEGGIRIDSTVGVGTTVEIFLPRAALLDEAVVESIAPTTWRGRETVLVADDDEDVRDIAVACLREYGYRVLEASSGVDALETIGREAAIDLLVIDYAMPRMNGAETVRLARRVRPDLEVLFITGYADLRALHEHVDAQSIVQKPFKLAQFADRVAKSLARRANALERAS